VIGLGAAAALTMGQRWYEACNATWMEITDYLRSLGFHPVRSDVYENPTRWFHPAQNIALFDVGQNNIVACA
jgi:hypothetical protein